MQQSATPPSKLRVALAWLLAVGTIGLVVAYFIWRQQNRPAAVEDSVPTLFRSIFLIVIGGVCLAAGVVAYVVVLSTNCFTFNFDRQVWPGLKGKIFLANIFVPLPIAVGMGCLVGAVVSPMLIAAGVSSNMANFLPIIGSIFLLQIIQLWILIWAPLEKRIITSRLLALGLSQEHLATGVYLGLSNPAAGRLKRMGLIEENMGALWVG